MQARRIQTIFSHINPRNIEKVQSMATTAGLNSEELRQLINRQLQVDGLQIVSGTQIQPEFMEILTPAALRFVANLNRKFNGRRLELLARRTERQKEIDAGKFPTFLPETKQIRDGDWKVAPIPKDIQDRRVEITGPVDRKMVINALNSGASCFMADFEDSHTPTFENNIYGHINMRDAVLKAISFKSPEGKEYKLNPKTAVLFVRPRGWHLNEKCITLDGVQISGSLYDFGLFFFHNVKALLESGSGPYFYLPKMESHLEARLWNDVFNFAQDELGVPRGTIRATVLIETILAAFEMDEILYELRDHSAGLNCGRWDYIFSYIKKFRNHPQLILPERGQVTMTVPFMKAYVDLLIKTCHKRGIHAMGGMAAQIPVRDNPELNKLAMDKVTADKLREVTAGHDGTWVAHPGLVSLAKKVFDEHMKTPNQIHITRSEVQVNAEELIAPCKGTITAAGIRSNLEVGIRYMEAWLRGVGCVPIHNMVCCLPSYGWNREFDHSFTFHPNNTNTDICVKIAGNSI
eukprot:TRINITY_DN1618_c0_g2_i2.p1 TRINITY_DN1618_c0_g2~~TRINITY_DN1618_c0_g2_i2.p1  ORF type:complete len:520 (-),score=119.16 TRINITY_DN1618_c0_g2_i2:582-2141(-)